MERSQFTVRIAASESPTNDSGIDQPTLCLEFDGTADRLYEHLSSRLRDDLSGDEVDVSFRTVATTDQTDTGMVTLSDRITGAYILEVKMPTETVIEFVQDVRTYAGESGQDPRYTVQIRAEEKTITTFEQELLLVYDSDGTLRRHASLIPNDTEV